MQNKNPILLNPEDYQNIKYKGLHRQKTIDESNKQISEIIKNFNESRAKKSNRLMNDLNSIVSKLIKKYNDSNKTNLNSFLTNKIDYNSIAKYFENSTEEFKYYTDFYIGNDAPKYSPKDLVKEFSKCSASSLKELDNSINEYTKKFESEIGKYGQLIEQNKKKVKERFDKTTVELGFSFSRKMGEIIKECFKNLENPSYDKSEFENTQNKKTVESWEKKIKNAKKEFDKHIEEYAINMFLKDNKGSEYLENLILEAKNELEKQMLEVLENYQKELEENIDEYIKKKEKENQEKILNDETQFTENLTNCKKLLEQWINELKKYQKEHTSTGKKAKSHLGKNQQSKKKSSPEGRIGTAIERLKNMSSNIPSSLENINPDVCSIIDNIIDAADVKTLFSYSNDYIKSYKLPGKYKGISDTNIKKSILYLIKIVSSSDLKNKKFIDSYVKWVKGEKK